MPESLGKVDLNTARRDDLTRIVGIGGECADRIIQYRERHGRIQSIEELAEELKCFGGLAISHLREQATT